MHFNGNALNSGPIFSTQSHCSTDCVTSVLGIIANQPTNIYIIQFEKQFLCYKECMTEI